MAPCPNVFPYDVSAVSQDLATWAYIQGCSIGQFVSLVVSVLSVEHKWTDSAADPYEVVYGRDMDAVATGALRLWRFEEGDLKQGSIYIIRGLKVVAETRWSHELYKYAPLDDGSKTVECFWRTALEDVTQVREIAQFF